MARLFQSQILLWTMIVFLVAVTGLCGATGFSDDFESGEINSDLWEIIVNGENSAYELISDDDGGNALYMRADGKGGPAWVIFRAKTKIPPKQNYTLTFDFTQRLDGQGAYANNVRHATGEEIIGGWHKGENIWRFEGWGPVVGGFRLWTLNEGDTSVRWDYNQSDFMPDFPYRFTMRVRDGEMTLTIYDIFFEEIFSESGPLPISLPDSESFIEFIALDWAGTGEIREAVFDNIVLELE